MASLRHLSQEEAQGWADRLNEIVNMLEAIKRLRSRSVTFQDQVPGWGRQRLTLNPVESAKDPIMALQHNVQDVTQHNFLVLCECVHCHERYSVLWQPQFPVPVDAFCPTCWDEYGEFVSNIRLPAADDQDEAGLDYMEDRFGGEQP